MNLQKNIDLIFLSPKNKEEKLVELKKLLSPFHQIIYTDFDDTLTDEKSLLYTKVKWLKKKGKAIDDIFLQKHTILHQKTLQLLAQRNFKELIIISRNDHQVLKLFIKLFSHQFQEQGIHIKACIGCGNFSLLSIQDKLTLLPDEAVYLCDIFEYRYAKKFKQNILCNQTYSVYKVYKKTLEKLFYFLGFLIKG